MSFLVAEQYINNKGFSKNIIHFEISTATVDLAAKALNVSAGQIAKTLAFKDKDGKPFLVIMAGDYGVDNKKFKDQFNFKASMIKSDEVENLVGHAVGGVCPFGIKPDIDVFMDDSLKQYNEVFPACGDQFNVLHLTVNELFTLANAKNWINVSKARE